MFTANEKWVEIVEIRVENEPLKAYNLSIADYNTYFVQGSKTQNASPVWVHNDCYNSLRDWEGYPDGFTAVQNGTRNVRVNNKGRLRRLRDEYGERNWVKVYKDGYDKAGNKISIHYFRSDSGRIVDPTIRRGFSNG